MSLICARCLLALGITLMLVSIPLLASIGPYTLIAGLIALVAGILLAPRGGRS